jgi:hypothetical protein
MAFRKSSTQKNSFSNPDDASFVAPLFEIRYAT